MSFQVRRLLKGDDVHSTTAFEVKGSKTVKEDATVVTLLEEFEHDVEGLDAAVVGQLNRLQRSLKGLPPLIDEQPAGALDAAASADSADPAASTDAANSASTGKKIVFE